MSTRPTDRQKLVKRRELQRAVISQVRKTMLASSRSLTADDGDDNDNNRLKVLIDGDGMKMLMDIYNEYISEDDFVKFPIFMQEVDKLLLKHRNGRPLTREEREQMNEAPAPKRGKKKKKAVDSGDGSTPTPPPIDSGDQTMTSSDNLSNAAIYAHYMGRGLMGLYSE